MKEVYLILFVKVYKSYRCWMRVQTHFENQECCEGSDSLKLIPGERLIPGEKRKKKITEGK